MRRIAPGVYLETKFPGVNVGAIVGDGEIFLVDSPLRVDDTREWASELSGIGQLRYLALMDHHPDRVLGSRSLAVPKVAHEASLQEMKGWSDTYKGSAHPIGAEADRLKRVTGVGRVLPELMFSESMEFLVGGRRIRLVHRPGPMAGSMWVLVPDANVVFIGDTVTVAEPPYVGQARVDSWLESLDELRQRPLRSWRQVSSRDGLVNRNDINAAARFVRRIPTLMNRLSNRKDPPEAVAKQVAGWMKSFNIPAARRDLVLLRLTTGLTELYVNTITRPD